MFLSFLVLEIYFVGCLAYADDLTLIAPSRNALQTMISICDDYAADYDVIFNGSKSYLLIKLKNFLMRYFVIFRYLKKKV